MSAKLRKARKSMRSFSKREKILRKPLSLQDRTPSLLYLNRLRVFPRFC